MKTRYKITIIAVVIAIVIFVTFSYMNAVILCEDRLMNQDKCWKYLEEKYSNMETVQYFKKTYPDSMGLSMTTENFQAVSLTSSSILADKVFAFLIFDLNASTFTYICQNHNLGDDYLVIEIVNPTIEELEKNHCGILNQLEL